MKAFSAVVIASVLALLGGASAHPVEPELERRDVFSPPVKYPCGGTEWKIGKTYPVIWDASNPPASISSQSRVVLARSGTLLVDESGGYNYPLGKEFDILANWTLVTIPNAVQPGDDYQLLLFGDSDTSRLTDKFTISA